MEKRILILAPILGMLILASCQNKKNAETSPKAEPILISEHLRFCESTYSYDGGVLIANFGTEQLNPLNTEGKGYIALYKDGVTNIFIPADGNLSAPKGMCIKDNYLFICDVAKIVVYNLSDLNESPQTIAFPKEDLFVNDLIVANNTLYVSVTNTGRIYSIDLCNLASLAKTTPIKWLDIAGPNGITIENQAMYVASYPADGQTTEANVIYKIADLLNPVAEKFITVPGQYDGIAFSTDKKTLYVTNWTPASISAINMESHEITPVDISLSQPLAGPADITIERDSMYIPDLPNSRVVILPLK